MAYGDDANTSDLNAMLKELQNMHYPCGPNYTSIHKSKAALCMKDNELEAIYSLVESHAPSLRFTAATRYEKALDGEPLSSNLPLNKNNLNFKCSDVEIKDKIRIMLEQLNEMPKEWTIVQLTSKFNLKECLEVNGNEFYTNPLHITVFHCNKNEVSPFMVTVEVPKDKISGNDIEIRKEMHSILIENLSRFSEIKKVGKSITQAAKQKYCKTRRLLNYRLKSVVEQIQSRWLGVWRSLLLGKLHNEKIQDKIESLVEASLSNEDCDAKTEKIKNLLKCLFNASSYLSIEEIKTGLHYVFPKDEYKELRLTIGKTVKNFSKDYNLSREIRQPVILIVDEKLDLIPWEMIDVLQNHPVSRMPSLHFTYALFKEHVDSIIDGWMVNVNSKNGTYIINPSLDLKEMQVRMCSFFKYWLPKWSGLVGTTPSESEFQNMLSNSDIFVYSGHGNGTQFLAGEKIQKLKVNAVVFLFGCGSVQLQALGPEVEMYSSYHMYLIACSPCVIGTLWAVTDIDTDIITTELLSQCVQSEDAASHWKLIDDNKWKTEGTITLGSKKTTLKEIDTYEPELLRALCKAKKAAAQYLVQAAFVARGLPVKIQN